jgi:hypothetical protein
MSPCYPLAVYGSLEVSGLALGIARRFVTRTTIMSRWYCAHRPGIESLNGGLNAADDCLYTRSEQVLA